MDGGEVESIRIIGNVLQSLTGLSGKIEPGTGRFTFPLAEFDGDITAHGGDLNANVNATTADARVNLQTQQITRGAVWYDQSLENVVLENDVAGKAIVLNVQGGPVLCLSDTGDSMGLGLDSAATAPAYVDGYAILYYFNDGGGTRQLRVHRKDGASELDTLISAI
jgi:hypothetical protein